MWRDHVKNAAGAVGPPAHTAAVWDAASVFFDCVMRILNARPAVPGPISMPISHPRVPQSHIYHILLVALAAHRVVLARFGLGPPLARGYIQAQSATIALAHQPEVIGIQRAILSTMRSQL